MPTLRTGIDSKMRIGHGSIRAISLLLLVLATLSGCRGGAPPPSIPAGPLEGERHRVIFLHDNDHHFHRNFPDQVEAWIQAVRGSEERVYLVNAGDVLVRHRDRWPEGADEGWYRERGGELMRWMNHLGYDAMTLGNHDLFAIGGSTREIMDEAAFPLLSANVTVDTPYLPDPEPYIVLPGSSGDPSIVLVGLSVTNSQDGVALVQRDPIEVAGEYRHLAESHDAVVFLTHIGHRVDLELAQAHPWVAAILGGHSHTLVPQAIRENGVLVAQAGGHPHVERPDAPMWMGTVVLEFVDGQLVGGCGWVVEIDAAGVRIAGGEDGVEGSISPDDVVRCPVAA